MSAELPNDVRVYAICELKRKPYNALHHIKESILMVLVAPPHRFLEKVRLKRILEIPISFYPQPLF